MFAARLTAGMLAVFAILGCPNLARAWGASGHMVVAEIAYQQLGAAERTRAVQILTDAFVAGPDGLERFEKDLTRGLPADASANDRDHFIFLMAATWPDIIRDGPGSDHPHPLHDEFHKGSWHFINLPFAPPGDAIKLPAAPAPTPADMEPKDIISAIRLCTDDVKAPGTSKRIRAARLCFLLHMYGDIHQPLHATVMFSADKLAHGDQGGNLQLVRIPGDTSDHDRVTSIHSVFDGLFGHDTRLATLQHLGERIVHTSGLTVEALKTPRAEKDKMKWANESVADAIKFAYLDGNIKALRGMTAKQFQLQTDIKLADVPRIPIDYEHNAFPVAERRVALGGYRLADALTEAIGGKK